jgi:hypothetical protein
MNDAEHAAQLLDKLNAVIAGETLTPTAEGAAGAPAEPKQLQYKTRKIYNRGTKAEPRYVVTFAAVVYGQPKEFTPVGDRIDLAATDDPAYLLARDGSVWLNEGENDGCGPRCPVSLRDKPLGEVATCCIAGDANVDTSAAVKLSLEMSGGAVALSKVWRNFSHAQRGEILRVIVALSQ